MADVPQQMAERLGVAPLTEAEIEVILDAARDIAHNTERKWTPVTTFLMGVAVAGADGADRAAALSSMADDVRAALGVAQD